MRYIPEVSDKLRTLAQTSPGTVEQMGHQLAFKIELDLLESKAVDADLLKVLVDISCVNMSTRHYEPYTVKTAEDNIIHRHSYILLVRTPDQGGPHSSTEAEPNIRYKENKVVGFLAFRPIREHGRSQLYIWELQVAPSYQRKGVGQLLVSSLVDLGRTVMPTDAFSLCLTCSKQNRTGYEAYLKMGFALNGDSDDDDPFWILELKAQDAVRCVVWQGHRMY